MIRLAYVLVLCFGTLIMANERSFVAELSGDHSVPAVETSAYGRALCWLNETEMTLDITVSFTLTEATAAHIHQGDAATNGPVVFPFEASTSPIRTTWHLTESDISNLKAGNFYVNVHTAENPGGEIRGQLIAGDEAESYEVTVTNLTKGQNLAPALVVIHKPGHLVFEEGAPAIRELSRLAEDGNGAPMLGYQMLSDDVFGASLAPNGLGPGQSVTFKVRSVGGFNRVSVMGMLGITNDGFFAVQDEPLPLGVRFKAGLDAFRTNVLATVYDAGSEANTESCDDVPGGPCHGSGVRVTEGAEGFVHVHSGIFGVGDLAPALYSWQNPAARIQIRKLEAE